jgi:hypothetical protein
LLRYANVTQSLQLTDSKEDTASDELLVGLDAGRADGSKEGEDGGNENDVPAAQPVIQRIGGPGGAVLGQYCSGKEWESRILQEENGKVGHGIDKSYHPRIVVAFVRVGLAVGDEIGIGDAQIDGPGQIGAIGTCLIPSAGRGDCC